MFNKTGYYLSKKKKKKRFYPNVKNSILLSFSSISQQPNKITNHVRIKEKKNPSIAG
jgi:hypothetical protein